ncbi:MAG: YihY/virulence factor BrkB family protein [Bacteroidetes bacterium]|nr:YihY/virulence factor BrkB family protein [Bacteroidota bacterium]
MTNIVSIVKRANEFLNHKLWRVRLDKLDKKQGFLLKQLRIFMLAIKGFNDDKCMSKATALTYYTLFSIVPVIAIAFAIAKGFGFQETLQSQLEQGFEDKKEILDSVFVYANSMLEKAKGGVIAGFGVVLLLWSVMKLLSSIEASLNDIWQIKKNRTWIRKITDYLSILLIAPIFVFISSGLTVVLKTEVGVVGSHFAYFSTAGIFLLKLFSFALLWVLFTFLYMALPNTRVNFKAAALGGIVGALLFVGLEWVYITFQVGVARYSAIYGGLAALPLFLGWVQYSWFIVLFGAELAFANQNVDHYELENEIMNISDRYKRVIALMIANLVTKNFIEGGQPMTAMEIAEKLDLPVRLARNIIFEFTETGIFAEIKTHNDKVTAYQPGISESKLTVKYIIDKLDERGVNELPIHNSEELNIINRLMRDMDDVLNTTKGNTLVSEISSYK